jgi:hypothetical protein
MSIRNFETEEEREFFKKWKEERLRDLDSKFSFAYYCKFSKEWNKVRNEVLNLLNKKEKHETMDIFHIG